MCGPTELMVEADVIRRLQLENRLSRQFDIKRQILNIGSRTFEIVSVANPDRLPEPKPIAVTTNSTDSPSDDRENSEWPPYWAQIWDSAVVLSHALHDWDLRGKRVLDLGCGLGLVGTMAASLGANVTMCDIAPAALLFARLNAWTWHKQVRLRQVDWREDRLQTPRFQLILGADILYDCDEWPYLESFWREHILPDGSILLAEPNRIGSELFPVWIEKSGWQLTSWQVSTARAVRPFRLLQLRRPNGSTTPTRQNPPLSEPAPMSGVD